MQRLNPIGGILNEITLEYAGGLLQGETSFIKTTTNTQLLPKTHRRFCVGNCRSIWHHHRIAFKSPARNSSLLSGFGQAAARRFEGMPSVPSVLRLSRISTAATCNSSLIQNYGSQSIRWSAGHSFLMLATSGNSLADIEPLTRLPSAVGAGLYLDFWCTHSRARLCDPTRIRSKFARYESGTFPTRQSFLMAVSNRLSAISKKC